MMAAEVLNQASHHKRGISDGFAGRSFAKLSDHLTPCSESTMLSNDLCMWSIKLLGWEVMSDEATHC